MACVASAATAAGSSAAPQAATACGSASPSASGSRMATWVAPSAVPTRSTASRARSAGRDAAQRPLAQPGHDGLLVGLAADPAVVLAGAGRCPGPPPAAAGPSLDSTIPQLISPMNSLPSLRTPWARSLKRSGCSSSKYSAMLRS